MIVIFTVLTIISSPIFLIMILYVFLLSLIAAMVPLFSTICMNYLKDGQYINFGLARGLGSISYAAGAIIVGQLIEFFNPTVIAFVYTIASIALLILLYIMPPYQIQEETTTKKQENIFSVIKKYRIFFFILVAFTFMYAASTALSTYLINIVKNLGGNTSLYGIAVFCMAASEMPIMSITYRLLKNTVLKHYF